ncbi:MAG: hypothetical protein NXH72_11730 [Hyphomonadaceae bacterium]|nr:hypothetical protein [Hyphomonadaceae bacterium]
MAHSISITSHRIIRQTWITRDDLRANRGLVYVYGDNAARDGRRGLARQMRGEPNAHPVSISWGPHEPFTHATAHKAFSTIATDLDALISREPAIIVWPLPGLVPEFQSMPDEIRAEFRQIVRQRFQISDPV